jgi:cell pole-organizing protein PopZ
MRQAGEPSVEEILASIKQVIARDNRADSLRRDPAAPPAAPMRGGPADVLDLGMIAAQVLDEQPGEGPLLKPTTATAVHESLDALALLAQPAAAPQVVRQGETSLEGMVRDMLRPMLAEWLDANLPTMVDRLVAAEIARIARKKG